MLSVYKIRVWAHSAAWHSTGAKLTSKRVPEYIDLDVFECLTSELIMYPLSIIYALGNIAVKLEYSKLGMICVRIANLYWRPR